MAWWLVIRNSGFYSECNEGAFSGGTVDGNLPANAGDMGSIPGSGSHMHQSN